MAEDFRLFRDSVRKIAETDDLTEKVNRALDTVPSLPKENIDAIRTYGYQTGSGSVYSDSGKPPTGASGSQEVVDAAGDTITVPQNPISSPSNPLIPASNLTNTATDAIKQFLEKEGIKLGDNNTDAKGGGGGSGEATSAGGSAASDQAQTVHNSAYENEQQAALDSALEDLGATPEEIEKQREYNQQQENGTPGTVTAEGLANGNQTPSFYSGEDQWQYVDGIVGIDPDDPTKTIVTNLFPKGYLPSLRDSLAMGQTQWTDLDIPPSAFGWELGFFYTGTGAYIGTVFGPTPAQFPTGAIGYVDPTFGYVVDKIRNVTYIFNTGGDSIIEVDYQVYLNWDDTATPINTGWADAVILCDKITCTDMGTETCPTSSPTEPYWPKTNTAILNFVDGVLQHSPFDSEVPDKYKGAISSTVDYLLRNNDIWSLSPAVAGGFLYFNKATQAGLYLDNKGRFRQTVDSNTIKYFKPK